uniref:Uncharacterized protein n=1 Tax=Zonotrichia albicollis TaxID=44394 RepID=A0A8D2M5U2_ZONAL
MPLDISEKLKVKLTWWLIGEDGAGRGLRAWGPSGAPSENHQKPQSKGFSVGTMGSALCSSQGSWARRVGSTFSPLSSLPSTMVGAETLNAETHNVSEAFMELNEQMASDDGYDLKQHPEMGKESSTQEIYETKTKLRCESERGGKSGVESEGAAPDPTAVPTGLGAGAVGGTGS